jgi:hypothetical protein
MGKEMTFIDPSFLYYPGIVAILNPIANQIFVGPISHLTPIVYPYSPFP